MRDVGTIRTDWELHATRSRYFGAPHGVPGLGRALAGSAGTFVEIGCGDGNRLRELDAGRLLEPFERVVAFDLSPERVRRSRRLGLRAEIAVGDACAVDLRDAAADFVFSDQVIEHVPDDRAMAREIARILRAGGKAVVGSVLKARWAWYFHRCEGRWVLDPTHLREYPNAGAYGEVFTSAGLRLEACVSQPLSFAVADLGLRALIRAGLVDAGAAAEGFAGSRTLRTLAKTRVRLPGYRLVWAFLTKPGA